ncbi:MAG: alpha/beta hydrolase [Spirochaetes bacterium]|nr:alpha/beta hydrolase [Spirochaetota bacterium]
MKKIFRIIKWFFFIMACLTMLTLFSLLAYRFYLKNSTKIETQNGISTLEEITLGDLKQWILIRGEDKNNPVLIFLHGGLGMPMGGMASSRSLDSELMKKYTIVHWDQRGAGKSYNRDIPASSMTFGRLVEDCNELIDYIRDKLNQDKVFLVGHSIGTIVGIKTVYKYPEKINAYVGVGQLINDYEQQKIRYNFVVEQAQKNKDVKIQSALKEVGPPPYDLPKKFNEIENYILKYRGTIHNNMFKQVSTLMLSFLFSPEYSLSEGFRILSMEGMEFSMNAMWDEMIKINLTKEIQSIKVPIYFFAGKYDMNIPSSFVKDFCSNNELQNNIKLHVFENSAHFPMIEEKENYEKLLIDVVLKDNLN